MSSKVKQMLYEYIIIKEWIENEEFVNADIIVMVGTIWQAIRVSYLFKKCDKKIYYVTALNKKYKYRDNVKWIVFDHKLKRIFPKDDCNILFIPLV